MREEEKTMMVDVMKGIFAFGWLWLIITGALLVAYVAEVIVKGDWDV